MRVDFSSFVVEMTLERNLSMADPTPLVEICNRHRIAQDLNILIIIEQSWQENSINGASGKSHHRCT